MLPFLDFMVLSVGGNTWWVLLGVKVYKNSQSGNGESGSNFFGLKNMLLMKLLVIFFFTCEAQNLLVK
jgi:hypothetical protein